MYTFTKMDWYVNLKAGHLFIFCLEYIKILWKEEIQTRLKAKIKLYQKVIGLGWKMKG
jgi:hypothetical protein